MLPALAQGTSRRRALTAVAALCGSRCCDGRRGGGCSAAAAVAAVAAAAAEVPDAAAVCADNTCRGQTVSGYAVAIRRRSGRRRLTARCGVKMRDAVRMRCAESALGSRRSAGGAPGASAIAASKVSSMQPPWPGTTVVDVDVDGGGVVVGDAWRASHGGSAPPVRAICERLPTQRQRHIAVSALRTADGTQHCTFRLETNPTSTTRGGRSFALEKLHPTGQSDCQCVVSRLPSPV